MSVINRMLQEIDRRRTEAGADRAVADPDIRSVAAQPLRSARIRGALWMLLLLMVGAGAALVWWQSSINTPPAAALVTPPAALKPSAAAAVIPVAPAEKPVVPVARPATPAPLAFSETLRLSLKLSALVADAPAPKAVPINAPPASAVTPGVTTITHVPVRQIAADETVAAARALWDDGRRAAALATLREALIVAEAARSNRAITAIARELARLEVVDNRAQVALELLTRLETVFADDADAWALRGNAEQRLALHSEAAQSYLTALRLRPSEGKWMLGVAISLAASGKLEEAQAWVARARERDAVTPTIAAYLQQLGIDGGRR